MRKVHGYILLGLTVAVLAVYGALAWVLFAPAPQQASEEILLLPTRIVDVTSVAAQPSVTPLPTDVPATSTPEPASPTTPPTLQPTIEPTTELIPSGVPAQIDTAPTDASTETTPTVQTPETTETPERTDAKIDTRGEGTVRPLEVTIGCDPQELIDALDAKEDIINLAAGCTYTYTTHDNTSSFGANALPLINYDVIINGNGATIERDTGSGNFFRLFFINYPGSLTLNDVTLQGGDIRTFGGTGQPSKGNGGAILVRIGTLTLNNVNIFGSNAVFGGGIYVFDGGDLIAEDSSISGNIAYLGGGAIYISGLGSTVDLTNSVLLNNDGLEGGAVYAGGASTFTATGGSIGEVGSPNEARQDFDEFTTYWGRGGAIYSAGSGTNVNLYSLVVEANAAYNGGAIYNVGGAEVLIDNSRVGGTSAPGGNTAIADGGGIYNQGIGSLVTVVTGIISYNEATSVDDTIGVIDNDSSDGGGIFNRGGADVVISTNSTISNNVAARGGGIYSQDIPSSVTISDTTIADNEAISISVNIPQDSAPEDGGGISNTGGSILSLTTVTVEDNSAHDRGGGLFQQDGDSSATVITSLFDTNTAYNGGGVFVSGGSTISFTNTDFTSNVATVVTSANENVGGGGLFADSQATITLSGGSFSQNSANSGAGILINGAATMTCTDTDFTQNTATGVGSEAAGLSTGLGGGAVRSVGFNTVVTLTNNNFIENSAQDGGALLVGGGSNVTVTDANFIDNSATGASTIGDLRGGGAIWAQDTGTNLYINTSTFTQNQGESGAAIAAKNGVFVQATGNTYGASNGADANTGDTLLHVKDNTSQLQIIQSSIRNNAVGYVGYNDDAFLLLRQTMIEETSATLQGIILANDGDFVLDAVRTILVNVTISHEVTDGDYRTFRALNNINPIELYFVTVVDREEILWNQVLMGSDEGEIQVYSSILETTATVCDGSGYTSGGYNILSDNSCGFAATGDQPNTDAQLTAQTQGGDILYYEPDDLGAAAGAIPLQTCSIGEDQRDVGRPQGPDCEPGAIEIREAYATYTSAPPINSDILLQPLAGEVDSADIIITETGNKDLQVTSAALNGDPEITLSGDTPPFTIVDDSGNSYTLTVSCSSAQPNTEYSATLTVEHTGYLETATYDIRCEVGGEPQTPTVQTVGLYQAGIWWIGSSDENPELEATYSFGSTSAGWQPVAGDWNDDDIDTAGLYKDGRWILREVSGDTVTYNQFSFGTPEAGWQAIAGDWNGDGTDGIGLYKDGLFLLRNSATSGSPDYMFIFGSSEPGWTALAGDWDGNFVDSIGLYKEGRFLLRNANSQGAPHFSFTFGGGTGIPLTGDWDGDGTDTIGLYNNPSWMLRNSNSTGNPDRTFTFGYPGMDFAPIIGTYSGVGAESLDVVQLSFGLAIPETPIETATPTAEATEEITEEPTIIPTHAATEEVTEEATSEVTPEATEEATVTPTPEVTEENTPEVTPPPVEVTEESTSEPTVAPTQEITQEPTPEATPTQEVTPSPMPQPTIESTPEITPEVTQEPGV